MRHSKLDISMFVHDSPKLDSWATLCTEPTDPLCATRTPTSGHTWNCDHPIESWRGEERRGEEGRGGEGIIYHVILPFSFVSPIGSLLYSFTVFKSILPLSCREKEQLTNWRQFSCVCHAIDNFVITLSKHEATDEWLRRRIITWNLSTAKS